LTAQDLSTIPRVIPDSRRPAGLAAILALALLVAGARAQFRTDVETVELFVSVTDGAGRPVTTLGRDDFEVFDNDVRQPLSVFAAGNVPLALAVAIDRSFSVAGKPLEAMKAAVDDLVRALQPDDRLLLLAIGSQVDVLAPFGTDRSAQRQALAALNTFGSTSLHDAIVVAIDRIQEAGGRRVLVLLSDGDDRYSQASATEVLAHARNRDVLIYPLAVRSEAGAPPLFHDLAAATGGEAFAVRNPARVGATLRTLAAGLRAQYMLGYVPPQTATSAAEWRRVRVVTRKSGLTVRTRQGYWTRAPK